jgi:hypothetical protein
VIISAAKAPFPVLRHILVGDIVVARKIKKWHFQFVDKTIKLVPLHIELSLVFGIALDQIADAHNKFGLEQV